MRVSTRHSADQTRAVILKAAVNLFAKYGFAGASISLIAKASKINKSLIYHHFKSKDGLWDAVRQDIYAKYLKQYGVTYDSGLDLKTFLSGVVSAKFIFFKNNPNVYKIISWYRLVDKPKALPKKQSEYTQQWFEVLKSMQQQGKIRDDYSTEMITLLVRNVIHGALDVDKFILNQSEITKKQEEYLKLAVECLFNTLKPPSTHG